MLRRLYQLYFFVIQGEVEIIDEYFQSPQVWLQRQAGVNARGAQRHAARWTGAVAIVKTSTVTYAPKWRDATSTFLCSITVSGVSHWIVLRQIALLTQVF